MGEYRYVGLTARNFEVGETSTMYGTGDLLDLSDDDVKANKDLIDSGLLLKVPAKSKTGGDK